MKIIELTKKHHKKLLEMCNTLFPDSEWCMSDQKGNCGMHSQDYNQIFVYEGTKPYAFPKSVTHWFEFCAKHIANKIYHNVNGWQDGNTTYSSFLAECVLLNKYHPIDYLYTQFKRNQHEKTPVFNSTIECDNGIIPRKEMVQDYKE